MSHLASEARGNLREKFGCRLAGRGRASFVVTLTSHATLSVSLYRT